MLERKYFESSNSNALYKNERYVLANANMRAIVIKISHVKCVQKYPGSGLEVSSIVVRLVHLLVSIWFF